MAVTKTSLVSVLVVLAITYNQGAARPSDITNNGLSSEEELEKIFKIPKTITKGLVITLNGTIDPNKLTFIVELPSISGKESCQFKYNYITDKMISISPAVDGYESFKYDLIITPGSIDPTFSLVIVARMGPHNNYMFSMTFDGQGDGPSVGQSHKLFCKIDNFDDIDQIVIKQGVARVKSLLFEFE